MSGQDERGPFEVWAESVGLAMEEPRPATSNPEMAGEMPEGSGHWQLSLSLDGRTVSIPFSMGPAHRRFTLKIRTSPARWWFGGQAAKAGAVVPYHGKLKHASDRAELARVTEPIPPTLEDVLECLQGDAYMAESRPTFAEWCGDYGYDEDSRAALAAYHRAQAFTAKLETFLGAHLTAMLEVEP